MLYREGDVGCNVGRNYLTMGEEVCVVGENSNSAIWQIYNIER